MDTGWPSTLCSTERMVTVSIDDAQSLKIKNMAVNSTAKETANRLTISMPPFL